jgi:diguanylate cyclase (GGDEF)-like protein
MHRDGRGAQAQTFEVDLEDTILNRRMEAPRPCRVLIVDDDDMVRARLTALLRAAHYDVDVAASGAEALRVLKSGQCQIVLTDWQMPDMDGLALCRHIRLDQNRGYVYVLMFTVRDSKQDLLSGLAAGADDYVVKGAPIDEILARLDVGRRITHVEHSLRTSNWENHLLAVTDPLTGAHNLRYLAKQLPRELARSQRYGHPLAVLSCDIDHFKQVNDRYGHDAGDQLLRTFVALTEGSIRKDSDWLARVGGDEFMIVLPETTLQGANRVARKLRRVYALEPVSTDAGPIEFSVSIGVTALDSNHTVEAPQQIRDLLRAADRQMYATKRRSDSPAAQADHEFMSAAGSNGGKHEIN